MLEILGLDEKRRNWIKMCLESRRVSVLVNRSPTEEFKLRRGLR